MAQETNQAQLLQQQLRQLQDNFARQQRELRESMEKLVREQQAQIDALQKQIATMQSNAPPAGPPDLLSTNMTPQTIVTSPPNAVEPAPGTIGKSWSPSDPIRIGGNQKNYINVSFDGLFAAGTSTADDIQKLELGGHDPNQRGFTVQNLETVFEGKVDPYFRGQANIVLQIDPEGETTIEAEEAYLETMFLPANLQVKAGQYFSEFGRLNPMHPHTWDFVDQPLVNGRFLGPDGLRSAGARVSWLAPTPFYSELFLSIQNSQGETAYSFRDNHDGERFLGRINSDEGVDSLGDMLFVPRYAASFDLTDSQTILAGVSAAFGPNSSGPETDTQIYGVDLFYKWKSPHQNAGFPFVTWQTEAMLRRYEAGAASNPTLPRETLKDWGMYSQVAWGFHKGWVAAFRGDYVAPLERGQYENILGTDPDRARCWRISPDMTYYPSEFSKIRFQYNFDDRDEIGNDHSFWLQFEFLLGAHAAHKF